MQTMPTRAGFVVSVFAASLAAQTVHLVDANQSSIQTAIAAAAPGDIIAIAAGSYAAFTLDKALTIRAEPLGAVVEIGGWPSTQLSTPIQLNLPAGAHARVCGLELRKTVINGSGVASFEQCHFRGWGAALNVVGGHATLWRCRTSDAFAGITAQNASLALTQCDIRGALSSLYLVPTSAVYLRNATMHAASTVFVAGNASGNGGGFACVHSPDASTIDLVDCSLLGGDTMHYGDAAISTINSSVRHQRCQFTSGTGPLGAQGPVLGPITAAPLLGVEVLENELALGSTFTTQFRGENNGLVLVLAAFELQAPGTVPLVAPLHWGYTSPNVLTAAVLFGDANGVSSLSVPIPADPALRDLGIWLSGIEFATAPLQISPPVGGALR